MYEEPSPDSFVSILVLLDSWAKTALQCETKCQGAGFQSLFCWIHGLRLVCLFVTHCTLLVSILVLLDSWAKTQDWQHKVHQKTHVSILVLLDSWAKTTKETCNPIMGACFNPCFVGFMG